MSTFTETDHPRNHPTGRTRFSEKANSAPEGGLHEERADAAASAWIIQVNKRWQIAGTFWGDVGTVFVGHDLEGDGYTHNINGYRFPAGWRSHTLDVADLPSAVKAAVRRLMRSWP